jgi:tight adherence protein B
MKTLKKLAAKREEIHFLIVCYLGVFITTYLFYNSIWLSLISFVFYPFCTKPYIRYLEKQRIKKLQSQFRDLLYSFSASFAAGRQMTEALVEAKKTLEEMYPQNAPIVRELTIMTGQLLEAKETEERVLIEFASRCKIPDITIFVDVYVTCRSTGGDMEKAILRTVKVLLEKMEIQEEIRVMTSQKKLEGKIITSLPFLILVLLRLTSPSYLIVLYETFMGRLMMTGALFLIYIAYVFIEKITTIEV